MAILDRIAADIDELARARQVQDLDATARTTAVQETGRHSSADGSIVTAPRDRGVTSGYLDDRGDHEAGEPDACGCCGWQEPEAHRDQRVGDRDGDTERLEGGDG
jgi:hypothetical protein